MVEFGIDSLTQIFIMLTPFIFVAVQYFNSQQVKRREMERTIENARIAEDVKIKLDERTEQAKKMTEAIAEKVEKELEIAKEKIDGVNKDIVQRIESVNNNVMEMLDDLKKRADLTNGNVATIRTDIADLQDQMEDLFISHIQPAQDDQMTPEQRQTTSYLREQKRKRRFKRQQIDKDRVAQSERNLNPTRFKDK